MLTAQQKAERAERILSDPVFMEAVEELDAGLVHEWRTATTTIEREAAFFKQEALGSMLRQLRTITSRG